MSKSIDEIKKEIKGRVEKQEEKAKPVDVAVPAPDEEGEEEEELIIPFPETEVEKEEPAKKPPVKTSTVEKKTTPPVSTATPAAPVQTTVKKEQPVVSKPPEVAEPEKSLALPMEYEPSEDILGEIEKLPVREAEEPNPKLVITIFGQKGHGKTFNAMSLPGKVMVISFDRKAAPIKYFFYSGDERIKVYEPTIYMAWEGNDVTKRGEIVFQYIKRKLLGEVAGKIKPEWIVFDNVEVLEQILELAMRYRYGLPRTGGIRDLNIWKERRYMLKELHELAMTHARYGVVYTTYVEKRTIFNKATGEFIEIEDSPHWVDIIKFETDVIMEAKYDEYDKEGKKEGVWKIKIRSSKVPIIPTGVEYDVSNNPIGNQIDWNEWRKIIEKAVKEKKA